ncbi:MAG: 50S ribosomal protein L29 [Deltaproteobacteria bacterium]|nr:MAG: 50S ribosomal protein L29 [Deltaproteobacteria bacterium]PIE75305.1 MAG: 50S ribosomal protein L29 [Deltaproteobacteria bacterium]
MKASELREKSIGELEQQAKDLKQEFFNLRFQHRTGQLENTSALPKIKKNIARVLTVLNEQKRSRV